LDTRLAALSLAFHQSLAQAVVNLAQSQGVDQLLLAGGCFQNKLLLERCVLGLQQVGVRAIWCQQLPCNDASLPIGQLLAVPQI
ncbi:MAG: carbamoyltransferase HypF, partial [Synechococcaceae bacterium WB9_4xC_028]|nr:carbamoyltransferase HypF [Synechococcaceae bacterium WB9_4xC_028]